LDESIEIFRRFLRKTPTKKPYDETHHSTIQKVHFKPLRLVPEKKRERRNENTIGNSFNRFIPDVSVH